PLAVARQPLERFIAGHDRPQRPLDQLLLRLGVSAGNPFFIPQRRSVVAFVPRRMPFGAVVVGKYELALLIGRKRRIELADQFFGWLGRGIGGAHAAWRGADRSQRGRRADSLEKFTATTNGRQFKTFIALRAIVFGFVEHGGSPAREEVFCLQRGKHGPLL